MQELEVEALALRGQLSETRLERDREQEEVTQSLSLQVQNLQVPQNTRRGRGREGGRGG